MSAVEFDFDEVGSQLNRLASKADARDGDALAEDFEPPSAEELEQREMDHAQAIEGAQVMADFVVQMAENTAVTIWPFLEYDDALRERTARKLAPVLLKYGGEPPPWLAKYREELEFAGCMALVIVVTMRQIKQHEAANDDPADDQEGQGGEDA